MRWLLCILLGHKWGHAYEVGCSGEYDSNCIRCDSEGSEHDEEKSWRRQLASSRLRELWHQLLCRMGRHRPHDFNEGGRLRCAWCFDEVKLARAVGEGK